MTPFLWIMAGGFLMGLVLLIVFSVGRTRNALAALISVVVSLVCLGAFVLDITIEPYKNGFVPTEEPSEAAEIIQFDEIYWAYKSNELAADDLYKGNRYQITAYVAGIESDGLLNLSGGATLTMRIQVDNTIVFFLAEFEKEQEENLKKIVVGDTITFEGTCLSAGTWTDCVIR